jgi:hypothetical protein
MCLKGKVHRSDLEDDWLRAFEDKQVDGEELRRLYSAFRSDVTGFLRLRPPAAAKTSVRISSTARRLTCV